MFLLCEPGVSDPSRSRFLQVRESSNQINQRLIRFPVLRRKARNDVAEVVLVELRVFADLAGKEAFTKRTEGNEPDPEFLEGWDHFRFRLSPPKRIFALNRHDRLNGMRAP